MSLVMLAGVTLRCSGLCRPLSLDEGYTQWVASHPFHQIGTILRSDVAPPLYYWLLRFWTLVAGDSELALRLFSAVMGVAALAIVPRLASCLTGRHRPAILSATALAAVSPLLVGWSQEARNYSLLTLSLLIAAKGMFSDARAPSLRWLALYLLGATASAYTHNIAWFYLAAFHLAGFLWPRQERSQEANSYPWFARLLLADGLLLLIYAAWTPSLLEQIRFFGDANRQAPPSLQTLLQMLGMSAGFATRHAVMGAAILLAFVVLMCGLDRSRCVICTSILSLGPLVLLWTYSRRSDPIFIVPRVGIPAAALIPLTLGAIIAVPRRGALSVGMASTLLLIGISLPAAWDGPNQRGDWRAMTAQVHQTASPRTLLVFMANEGELLYRYYSRRLGLEPLAATGLPRGFLQQTPPRCATRIETESDLAALRDAMADPAVDQIVLVLSHVRQRDPNGTVRATLEAAWTLKEQRNDGRLTLCRYQRPGS